jgi:formate hydrogenlyase subunit 3/multisubunit Na+/H+ antiporter MnhD subunit
MSPVASGLLIVAGAVGGVFVCLVLTSSRVRSLSCGVLTCAVGCGGILAGVAALLGHRFSLTVPGLLPLSRLQLDVDPLAGLFMTVIGGVALAAGVYSVGYPHPPVSSTRDPGTESQDAAAASSTGASSRTVQAALPLFAAAMLLVPAASNVTTFLVAWELMALLSLVLVLAEHRLRPQVTAAGIWYAAMTHAGLVAILLGLVALSTAAGTESFAGIRAASAGMPSRVATVVFILTLLGFGSKAGLVPLHVWLPRAHPEAPSYVSALMSAAMVNLGVYGVLRVGLDLLDGGPRWWWLLVLTLGAVSAVFGVLQASVATDFKVLLAYSTTENLGLVFVGIGAAGVFASTGDRVLAGLLMVAALLHVVNHAGFKTLLFLGAGAVLRNTGTRDLDQLGGLARPMPVTTALVGVGALAASGLPPGNGFVSEWLLLQGLIHSLGGAGAPDVAIAIAMPLALGAVALTAGLGVMTFVKAFGVGFLARPRSAGAAAAHEVSGSLRAAMVLAAVTCVGLAFAPTVVTGGLSRVLAGLPSLGAPGAVRGEITMRLSGVTGSMSPLLIAVGLAVAAVVVTVLTRILAKMLTSGGGARRPRRATLVWGCGGTRLSPRMQYTATAYAEPLTRVFDDVLRPEHDLDITHHAQSAYLVESVRYRQRVPDRVEARLYPPLLAAARWWATGARRLQNGSTHRYLAYGLIGLLVVLAAVGVTS